MNCSSFRQIVQDLDRPNCLEEAAYDTAIAHAQTCTRCARELHRLRELSDALRALAGADNHLQPSVRLEADLVRAFRAQSPIRMRRSRAAWWITAAAAAALAVGVGMLWRRASGGPRAKPAQAAVLGALAGSIPSKPASTADVLGSKAAARTHARRSVRANAPSAELANYDELSEFVALPFAHDETPLGAGEVVRIRLSESALGLLGLPVSEDNPSEPLTADVVIGEDGVARAIRFVSGPVPAELVQSFETTSFKPKGAKQ
ncbi:MAG TPA: hypothetical protein VL523_14070 [Terriglobia bacterium]|nr:hypothetical protein [Terriglobia bacterium]